MEGALIIYLILVLIVAPLVSWRAAASGIIRHAPRPVLYRAAIGTSWFLALLGAAVLWWDQRLAPADVGLVGLSPGRGVLYGTGTLAALLAGAGLFALARRLLGRSESPELLHLIPRTAGERRVFVLLALTAGLTEEFVFRGIAITALSGLLAPVIPGAQAPWAAAALVSVSFGLGHGYQEPLGMVRAGVLGLGLAVPFLLSGSLLPGMFAHAAVDLTLLAYPARRLVGEVT
jgi:membrane protease YdiL (CAAX protease family)